MRKVSTHAGFKPLAFLFLLVCFSHSALAQNRITGRVTNALTGEGMQGVTVSVSGTTVATQTDATGNYAVTAAGSASLIFTFVGYETVVEVVSNRSVVDVEMVASAEELAEVVINIGYGTTRQKDLTGSVTQISADDFQKGQITTPEQLIAGKVAGVQIVSNSGAPGAGSTIRIRGGASLNASNDPLIVVDGVPVSSDGIAGSPNPLSLINPDDIESFTILKDASATAIYGSRASNGVIIITTKRGRAGTARINFGSNFSVSEITRGANVIHADKFRQIVRERGTAGDISRLGTATTDWQKVIYRTALTTDNNLSISGGVKNLPYRLSGGYLNQQGVLKTGNLERFSGSINLTPTLLNDHLKIDLNLKGSLSKSRFANEGAIGAAVNFDPTKPVYSDDNRYNGYWEWRDASSNSGLLTLAPRNPLGLLMDRHDNSNVKRSIVSALIDYKFHFLPDLHAFVNVGADYALGTGTIFVDSTAAQSYKRSPDGLHSGVDNQYKQERKDRLLEAYLNYTKRLESIDSRLEVVAGYGYQDFLTINHNYPDRTADGFVVTTPTFPDSESNWTLISYYGRANINIKDRYLLTGTIRTDGSSRFAQDERWGVFPSGAIAWNIKEEGFLRSSAAVNALKLRAGYGLTGQQSGIGLYDYKPIYYQSDNISQYQLGNQFYYMYAPGGYYPQRTWEKTATSNLGLDFGFANNRISGSVDVYYKETTDLLNEINQPAGSNFSNKIIANVGSMENKGIEVLLNFQPIKNNSLVWDLSVNGTYNENKITKLTVTDDPDYEGVRYYGISGGTGSTILVNSVGHPRGSFYVYQQVYGTDGLPIDGLLNDRNRDGIINEKDLYRYKKADPDYMLGLSSNLNINRDLNFGFVMRASIGNYVYNNNISATSTYRHLMDPLRYLANGIAYRLSPGSGDKYFMSDYYVQNASFLKMDNIYLNYTFRNVFSSTGNLTLNANIHNVFTVTNYIGLDPEIQSGIDNNLYPRPRVMSLGLNLNF